MKTRIASRYIPKNALPIQEPGLGVVYVYPIHTTSGLRYGVIGYREKAFNSDFHYTYKTDAEVDRKVDAFFESIRQHKQLVANRRTQRYSGHSFTVGDIVTNSWGYDQTNVDWYIVTRTTKNYVWLKPIASELVEDEGISPMSGRESVRLDENLKPIELDKPETKHQAEGDCISMPHGCGSKWTGEKKYSSWYA